MSDGSLGRGMSAVLPRASATVGGVFSTMQGDVKIVYPEYTVDAMPVEEPTCVSVPVSVCLSVRPSVYLSVCLPVCLCGWVSA